MKIPVSRHFPWWLHRGVLGFHGNVCKTRRLSLPMVNYYEDDEAKSESVTKKIYIIINDEKRYIDPEIRRLPPRISDTFWV